MLSCKRRPSRYGDLEDAFAAGAQSVVFAPVPCPDRVRLGKQGGACAVLALGIDGDADVDAPCAPTRSPPRIAVFWNEDNPAHSPAKCV